MRNMLFLVFFALALAGCAPAVVVRPLNDRAEKAPVDERIQGEADNPEAFSMVLHFCRPGAVCSEKAVRNLPVFPMIHKPSRTQQTCMFGKVTTPERRPFAAAAWGLILKTPIPGKSLARHCC